MFSNTSADTHSASSYQVSLHPSAGITENPDDVILALEEMHVIKLY